MGTEISRVCLLCLGGEHGCAHSVTAGAGVSGVEGGASAADPSPCQLCDPSQSVYLLDPPSSPPQSRQ